MDLVFHEIFTKVCVTDGQTISFLKATYYVSCDKVTSTLTLTKKLCKYLNETPVYYFKKEPRLWTLYSMRYLQKYV